MRPVRRLVELAHEQGDGRVLNPLPIALRTGGNAPIHPAEAHGEDHP